MRLLQLVKDNGSMRQSFTFTPGLYFIDVDNISRGCTMLIFGGGENFSIVVVRSHVFCVSTNQLPGALSLLNPPFDFYWGCTGR